MEDKSRVGSSRNARLCPLKPKGRVKKRKERKKKKKRSPPSRIQKLADAKGKRKVEGGTRFFLSVAWLTAPKRRALSDAGHTEQALLDCLVRKRSYRGLNLTFFAPLRALSVCNHTWLHNLRFECIECLLYVYTFLEFLQYGVESIINFNVT